MYREIETETLLTFLLYYIHWSVTEVNWWRNHVYVFPFLLNIVLKYMWNSTYGFP